MATAAAGSLITKNTIEFISVIQPSKNNNNSIQKGRTKRHQELWAC